MDGRYFVGVDLGGTNIKAGVLDQDARVVSQLSVPTEVQKGGAQVIANIVSAAKRAIEQAGVDRKQVAGIGIGSPGPMSMKRGMLYKTANLPFENVYLAREVHQATGYRTVLENDANAAAFGEYWAGAGKGVRDLVMFTLGTGVGGGVIVDGRLLHGYFENGGELGHILVHPGGRPCNCGQRGCVEAYSSAYHLARRAEEAIAAGESSSLKAIVDAGRPVMAEDVAAAAREGDAVAARVWDEACYYLAVTIVTMQHVTNPQRIVLAGGLIAAGDFLLEPIRKHHRELAWKLVDDGPEIRFATLGNDAGFIGAAGCAFEADRSGTWSSQ